MFGIVIKSPDVDACDCTRGCEGLFVTGVGGVGGRLYEYRERVCSGREKKTQRERRRGRERQRQRDTERDIEREQKIPYGTGDSNPGRYSAPALRPDAV